MIEFWDGFGVAMIFMGVSAAVYQIGYEMGASYVIEALHPKRKTRRKR